MRALGFHTPTPKLTDTSFSTYVLPIPKVGPQDLLIKVAATSINPVDYKERQQRTSNGKDPEILGWDGAGTVAGLGSAVTGFKDGDRVFWAGELRRQGTYAEYQAVDHRIVGHMPKSLDFAPAAALPLTSVTAYEAIFQRLKIPKTGAGKVLIIGGAGGVGSIAIQILRAETDAEVYATAGREDSKAWVKKMGAQHVVERSAINLAGDSPALPKFDYIFSTTNSDTYLKAFPLLLKPGGHLCLIDDPETFNIREFKLRSQTVSWELMFTATLFDHNRASQGRILDRIAELTDQERITSTINTRFEGMSPENLIAAHKIQESGSNIGKTVVTY